MGKISDLIGPIGGQATNTLPSSGGKIATLLSTVKSGQVSAPTITPQPTRQATQTTQPSSFISSAPQIISGIAKGISIGNLIVSAATRQATQPQVDVSKIALPTPQPPAPQKTLSITPNQKVLTPTQLKIVAPQPLSGQSAEMKQAKVGAPTITDRYVGLVSKTMPEAVKAGDQTASDISRFIKSPTTFQSSASYDANNTDSLVKSLITQKVTDFLHLPHEVPGMIEAVAKAVAGPIGQGLSLAMQEKLNPPKTVSEAVGLKAKQLANAGTIALTPINAFFAAADKTPIVSEIMRASIIPFIAVGEIAHKSIGKLVDALPISDKAKNDIKGPLGELAALAAQVVVGHSLARVSGEGVGKLNDVGKEAFTKITKDIVETSGGKTTVSFSPQDVRKVAVFNEGGKYHKELVDILAENGKAAGDLWTKAVKEGITIELPFEKVVGMVDKPWWSKIKKFLNMEPTKATTTTQVPGRIVEPGTASKPVEKQILGLLPERINHNPQAVIDAVMKGKLETTPEGKGLIKAALEAQQAGTDLTILTKPAVGTVTGSTTPSSEKLIEKASADLSSQGIGVDPKSIATEVLRQYQNLPPSSTIKNITPESIKSIVGTGVNELTFSPENTITLWRDNDPKVGQVNSFSLEKKFETQKPYVVNKADIAVNMSGEEIIKLFDEVYKNNAQAQEIYRQNLKDWKQNEAEVLVIPKEDYKIAETKSQKTNGAKDEFRVGDVLDPQDNTNMEGQITISEIKGNTIKFVDSKGQEYAGMSRSTVRNLIKGGSWKKVVKTNKNTQFHGTTKFTEDSLTGNNIKLSLGRYGKGFYLTTSEKAAAAFGSTVYNPDLQARVDTKATPSIYSFDLSGLKIKEITGSDVKQTFGQADLDQATSEGYDGVNLVDLGETIITNTKALSGKKITTPKTEYKRGDIGAVTKQIDEIIGMPEGSEKMPLKARQALWQENYHFTQLAADAGDPQALKDIEKIAELEAKLEELRKAKNDKSPKYWGGGSSMADVGGYSTVESANKAIASLRVAEFPEILQLAKELMGEGNVTLKAFSRALGMFYANPLHPNIKLNPSIFKDPAIAAKVLAHEIGHLIDFLPDLSMKRGNILGRLASLRKYLQRTLEEYPGAEGGLLTPEDRARLQKEAKEIAKKPVSIEQEVVVGEVKATPQELLSIWNDTAAAEKFPELLDYIQSLSGDQKAEIIKYALKNTIPEWVNFKKYQTEKKIVEVMRDAPEDIKKIYEDLVRKEIERRKLFSSIEVIKELKKLTQMWKPFDPQANAGFTKYRYSSRELYADAVSVLFNDPALLKETAPTFTQAFFNYLDNKPEVKALFEDLQLLLKEGPDAVNDRRLAQKYAGYEKARALRTAIENDKPETRSFLERFMRNHVTKNDPIYRKLNSKPGTELSTQQVRQALEEFQMRRNDQALFLNKVSENIIDALKGIGLTENDLGVVLELEREAMGDRIDLANPGGMIGNIPATVLDHFYKTKNMTQAQRDVFNQIKKEFHDMIFAENERAVANGNFNKEIFNEKILPNRDTYATFSVIHYIHKNYINAGIKKQTGTLSEIENPFTSTVLKTIALIEWNNLQEAKLTTIETLKEHFPTEFTEAKAIRGTDGRIVKFVQEDGKETLELMRDGKRIGYNVDPYIKSIFEDEYLTADETHALVSIARAFNNGFFKPLVTTYNLGWGLYSNIIRDQARTYIHLGTALEKFAAGNKGLSIAELLASYVRSIPEGVRFAAGKKTALLKEMLDNKALGNSTWEQFDPGANNDSQIAFLLRKYGVIGAEKPVSTLRKVFNNSLGKVLDAIKFVGGSLEATSKISGYRLTQKRVADAKLAGFIVRNYVGTPNYAEGGALKQIDNNIFVFSNIMLQSTRAAVELGFNPKTAGGYWWRTFKVGILPKILMAMGAAGVFGKAVKDNFDKQTEYDKTNYITVPIGFDSNQKAVYLRVPMDETQRFVSAVTWKVLSGILNGQVRKPEQAFALAAGFLPSTTPLFDVVNDWMGYVQGRNPYDSYRGRLAIDQRSWDAGGEIRLKKMVMYSLNQLGLTNFKTYDSSGASTVEAVIQKLPVISRMMQVSDYGMQEKYADKSSVAEAARASLKKADTISKYVQQSRGVTSPQEMSKLRFEMVKEYLGHPPQTTDEATTGRAMIKSFDIARVEGTNPLLDVLINSNTNAEKIDHLNQFKKDLTKSEYLDLVRKAAKYKILSIDLLKSMDSK